MELVDGLLKLYRGQYLQHGNRNMKLHIILLRILLYRQAISTCGGGGGCLPLFIALYENQAPTEVAINPRTPTTIPTISPVPSPLPPPRLPLLPPEEEFVVVGAWVPLVPVRELESLTESENTDDEA